MLRGAAPLLNSLLKYPQLDIPKKEPERYTHPGPILRLLVLIGSIRPTLNTVRTLW